MTQHPTELDFYHLLLRSVEVAIVWVSDHLENRERRLRVPEECCICLCSYEDGVDLHALPCNHHFHSTCIVKWLKMNATCPLCKYNILKGTEQV
ncbi:hypothetical protein Goklo_026784 [Gossypium klotzschianum]|uniref:RING-type E3 ubiquitin transferase n=1 Tax=Gossypium klotzschianum TaxID=34286 RepID=A0A7J8TW96_9ROSI|nr:hypothetical protein [Gossypium klotzschianum]